MAEQLELTERGYLVVPASLAAARFPHDVAAAVRRGEELWLYPVRGAAAGGLLLKQRNAAGDRSVLVTEVLGGESSPRRLTGEWDDRHGALRLRLDEAG